MGWFRRNPDREQGRRQVNPPPPPQPSPPPALRLRGRRPSEAPPLMPPPPPPPPPKMARTECAKCAATDQEIAALRAEAEAVEKLRAHWEGMWRRKCEQYAKVHGELDDAKRRVVESTAAIAELAAESVQLVDRARVLEASLSGRSEELRQAKHQHARAEQDLAELRKAVQS